MTATMGSRTLTVSINRRPSDVYDFASNPVNLPRWAAGLGCSIEQTSDGWIAQTTQGPVIIRFTGRNSFGILDHTVLPDPQTEIYVPMRVFANGAGSEITFTLFRLPAMSDQQYAEDAAAVERDLHTLKQLLETPQ